MNPEDNYRNRENITETRKCYHNTSQDPKIIGCNAPQTEICSLTQSQEPTNCNMG